jgi:hypothetical protein
MVVFTDISNYMDLQISYTVPSQSALINLSRVWNHDSQQDHYTQSYFQPNLIFH